MWIFGNKPAPKIFYGIDDKLVDEILANSPRETFAPGEIIMEQGEHPDGKGYILESGNVDVWVNGAQTAELTSKDMFGEFALLNEEPRSATVVAKDEVTTIVMSQEILFEMIENNHNSINKEIMRRMEENLENE